MNENTATDSNDTFEEDIHDAAERHVDSFQVDVDGYEGPLDVLLTLARDQKVDLTQISILQLADQYLAFVAIARQQNLELAADYLVMAAWLAYLKSKLLLPDMGDEDRPSGEEMAAVLAFQLRRLESVRDAGNNLLRLNQLGRDFFARGAPEAFTVTLRAVLDASLHDLMRAYGDMKRRQAPTSMSIEPVELYTVEGALERIRRMLGATPEWLDLSSFLPDDLSGPLMRRSAIASTFTASLELAREGKLNIRQDDVFGRILLSANNEGNQPLPEIQSEGDDGTDGADRTDETDTSEAK